MTASCEGLRPEIAAYVVGALRGDEATRLQSHLDGCPECRAVADELGGLPPMLALVPADAVADGPANAADVAVVPSPALLDRLLQQVAAARTGQRRRARRALAFAAAAAVVVGAGLGWSVAGDDSRRSGPVAVPEPAPGRMVASTDPTTGVRAEVDVRAVAWGTALRLRLTGVDPGQTCSLVAVAVGGARETAATWTVPERGYREGKLTVDGAVGMPKDKLARFDVVTTEGRILVRVAA